MQWISELIIHNNKSNEAFATLKKIKKGKQISKQLEMKGEIRADTSKIQELLQKLINKLKNQEARRIKKKWIYFKIYMNYKNWTIKI